MKQLDHHLDDFEVHSSVKWFDMERYHLPALFDLLDKEGEISEPLIDIDHLLSGYKCLQWNVRNIGLTSASYERHCNNKKQSLELEQGPFGESELPQATSSQAAQRLLSVFC